MQIINVNDDRYVVQGTVLAQKVTHLTTDELKNRYSLADTVLRNGDTLYICMEIINAEFKDVQLLTFIYNSSKLVKEDFLMLKFESWIENNIRYMECQICYDPVSNIDESVASVLCWECLNKRIPLEDEESKRKSTGRQPGWHWMKEFVDKDGNVYHKGVEVPGLKGTLSPTESKKIKRRSKQEIEAEKIAKYRKAKKSEKLKKK